jgi:hypothetical protein
VLHALPRVFVDFLCLIMKSRARCFADEGESKRFSEQVPPTAAQLILCVSCSRLQWRDGLQQLPLHDILRKFAADLVSKGKLQSVGAAMEMDRCSGFVPALVSCLYCFNCSPAGWSLRW